MLQCSTANPAFYLNPSAQHCRIVEQFCTKVPPALTGRRTVLIRIVSPRTLRTDACSSSRAALDTLGTIDGYYHSGGSLLEADCEIELSSSLSGNKLRMVLAHEFGHFVWFERMTSDERRTYRVLWRHDMHTNSVVTRYAQESPKEGFAEAFSWYLYRNARLKHIDRASWGYLRRLVQSLKSDDEGASG